jgi:hypothetical protein
VQAAERLDTLDEAVALAHHHDGITGTAKQAVANDYTRRLASATAHLQPVVSHTLSAIIFGSGSRSSHVEPQDVTLRPATPADAAVDVRRTEIEELDAQVDVRNGGGNAKPGGAAAHLPPLYHCAAANVSICPAILEQSRGCEVMLIVLHNPVAWTRTVRQQVCPALGTPRCPLFKRAGMHER